MIQSIYRLHKSKRILYMHYGVMATFIENIECGCYVSTKTTMLHLTMCSMCHTTSTITWSYFVTIPKHSGQNDHFKITSIPRVLDHIHAFPLQLQFPFHVIFESAKINLSTYFLLAQNLEFGSTLRTCLMTPYLGFSTLTYFIFLRYLFILWYIYIFFMETQLVSAFWFCLYFLTEGYIWFGQCPRSHSS